MTRIIEINNTTDPRLRRYANLRSDVEREFDVDSFIVEGRLCLQRLIASRHRILSVLVERGKEQEVAGWLGESTPLYSLPPEQIRELVGFHFHRGMLACGARPPLRFSDELRLQDGAMALAVLGVHEKENLGSMMRTAAALGIENLLLGLKTADPFSRRVIRVSMGAAFHLNLFALDDPAKELTDLQRTGKVRIIATTLDRAAATLDQFVVDDRSSILIVGNEAEGIHPSIQRIATDRVTIPMQLGTDSLNVSIAAAIFMYQLLCRRRLKE